MSNTYLPEDVPMSDTMKTKKRRVCGKHIIYYVVSTYYVYTLGRYADGKGTCLRETCGSGVMWML